MRTFFIAGIFFATVLGGLSAYRWWGSEPRIIEARLHELAELLTPAGGGELATVSRLAQLRNHFAPEVQVRVGGQEIRSRDALVALLARWEPPSQETRIEFVDISVSLAAEQTSAQVSLTATLSSRDQRTGAPVVDALEAVLTMTKLDGVWVVATVDGAETLQRP